MPQLYLPDEAPASTPEPPQPPPVGDKGPRDRKRPPEPDDEAPESVGTVAEGLYALLEREVVPAYYERDPYGLPLRWIAIMKQAIAVGGARFTARRMLAEYVRGSYIRSIEGDGKPDDPPTA